MKNLPEEMTVGLGAGAAVTALAYEPGDTRLDASLILAHGAGAGQRSAFMVAFAQALAGRGIRTVTFNFPYTEQGRKIPDRRPALEACYRAVVDACRRAANIRFHRRQIDGRTDCDPRRCRGCGAGTAGLVLLGYPLHPPDARPNAGMRISRHPPAGADCPGQSRYVRHTSEFDDVLAATSPRPTFMSKAAITRSRCRAENQAEPTIDGVQQTIRRDGGQSKCCRNSPPRGCSRASSWPPSNCNTTRSRLRPANDSSTLSLAAVCHPSRPPRDERHRDAPARRATGPRHVAAKSDHTTGQCDPRHAALNAVATPGEKPANTMAHRHTGDPPVEHRRHVRDVVVDHCSRSRRVIQLATTSSERLR